eukprot:1076299-Amphidinium_carterae.1
MGAHLAVAKVGPEVEWILFELRENEERLQRYADETALAVERVADTLGQPPGHMLIVVPDE